MSGLTRGQTSVNAIPSWDFHGNHSWYEAPFLPLVRAGAGEVGDEVTIPAIRPNLSPSRMYLAVLLRMIQRSSPLSRDEPLWCRRQELPYSRLSRIYVLLLTIRLCVI